MTASLFDDGLGSGRPGAPLAVRMRPRTLDDVVGQQHIVGVGAPLRRLLDPAPDTGSSRSSSVSLLLWGPPGTGKTTLASLAATVTGRRFVELSAVTAGVKDVRAVVENARHDLTMQGRGTVLFVDEVHRFNKTQQDALLPSVENGWVTLIAATTENPSFSVVAPLLSRSLVLTLHPLTEDDIRTLLERAVAQERGLGGRVRITAEAADHLVRIAGGDARRALTALEAAAAMTDDGDTIEVADVERAVQQAAVRYDKDGDQHYDVISGFIKSLRGSDVDAALHYLARMIEAGEDPRFIARRLVILASEDIGMADPSALQTAVAALQAVSFIGMPEARITLSHAVVHLALAPKSNAVYVAVDAAIADVRAGRIGLVPPHLRDAHYPGAAAHGHGKGYVYPHDEPGGITAQQYAPDPVVGRRYYQPTTHGAEARWGQIHHLQQQALGHLPPDAPVAAPSGEPAVRTTDQPGDEQQPPGSGAPTSPPDRDGAAGLG